MVISEMTIEDNKRIKKIFKALRPYVNGRLITVVFERYFDELEELVREVMIKNE